MKGGAEDPAERQRVRVPQHRGAEAGRLRRGGQRSRLPGCRQGDLGRRRGAQGGEGARSQDARRRGREEGQYQ